MYGPEMAHHFAHGCRLDSGAQQSMPDCVEDVAEKRRMSDAQIHVRADRSSIITLFQPGPPSAGGLRVLASSGA